MLVEHRRWFGSCSYRNATVSLLAGSLAMSEEASRGRGKGRGRGGGRSGRGKGRGEAGTPAKEQAPEQEDMVALAMEARRVLARVSAEENGAEKREAPDGSLYTKQEFEDFFGDLTLWSAAIEEPKEEAPTVSSSKTSPRAGGSAKRGQPAGTGRAAGAGAGAGTGKNADTGANAEAASADAAAGGAATPRKPRAKYVKGRGAGGGGGS